MPSLQFFSFPPNFTLTLGESVSRYFRIELRLFGVFITHLSVNLTPENYRIFFFLIPGMTRDHTFPCIKMTLLLCFKKTFKTPDVKTVKLNIPTICKRIFKGETI